MGARLGRLGDRFTSRLRHIPDIKIATRVRVVTPGGRTGGDLDVIALDAVNKEALVIEVKWPIDPLNIYESLRVEGDLNKGVTQLERILEGVRDGGLKLRLPADYPQSLKDWKVTPCVASPRYIPHVPEGSKMISASLELLNLCLPAPDLRTLIGRLEQRPKKGKDFKLERRSRKIFGFEIEVDDLALLVDAWHPR